MWLLWKWNRSTPADLIEAHQNESKMNIINKQIREKNERAYKQVAEPDFETGGEKIILNKSKTTILSQRFQK